MSIGNLFSSLIKQNRRRSASINLFPKTTLTTHCATEGVAVDYDAVEKTADTEMLDVVNVKINFSVKIMKG